VIICALTINTVYCGPELFRALNKNSIKGEMQMKVLVSDPLAEVGVKIFRETPGIEMDMKVGLKPDELKAIIGQ